MTDDCVFCKILAGESEASFVAQDDHAVAIMDIGQINPGHVLVIPRRHAVQLGDLSEDEAANVFRLVHRVAQALPKSGLRCEGYRLSQVNGAAAGQDVFHVHFHLVPRFRGEAVRMCILVDEERPRYSRRELDQFAARIAAVLE
ncbi:MAG: HIT family protein [Myxococcales bacterium]|nr:HIT family protein [Myxococcales bacterium]